MPPEAPKPQRRNPRELSLILLITGCVLLLPPGALLYQLEVKIAGIPVALVALFLIWAFLIAAGCLVSRLLVKSATERDGEER